MAGQSLIYPHPTACIHRHHTSFRGLTACG
jgi:hypothetical protein